MSTNEMGTLVRHFAGILFLAIVSAAPWFRGAFFRTPQTWLFAGIALACLLRLCMIATRPLSGGRWPVVFWAAAAGIPLGLFQLIPFAPHQLEAIAPTAARFRAEPTSAAPSALGAVDPGVGATTVNENDPLSIAPSRTYDQLAQLIVCCSVFLLAIELFPTVACRRRLLIVLTANGAALAFVALAQRLGDRTFVFWEPHSTWFGPFANRNNGAGYVNMCLAACCGLLWQRFADRPATPPLQKPLNDERISLFDPASIAALAAAVLMIAVVLASLSRGAILSIVFGLITTGIVVAVVRRQWRILPLLVAGIIVATAFVYWLGLFEGIHDRLNTLSNTASVMQDGRLANWRWGLRAAPAFSPLGSGLGTYAYAYPPFQEAPATERFWYPENAALQTWVEAGVLGIACFLFGLAAAFTTSVRRLLRQAAPQYSFLGLVGVLLLSTQAVHSFLDNGFYLPANMLLLACLCGAICGSVGEAMQNGDHRWEQNSHQLNGPIPSAKIGVLVLLMSGSTWAAAHQFAAAPLEQALRIASLSERSDVSVESITERLEPLLQALQSSNSSAEAQRRAAELYMLLYQRRTADELLDADGLTDREQAWSAASPSSLYAAAARCEREGDSDGLQSLRNNPLVLRYLVPAWEHLHRARDAAPTDATTALYLGELQFLVGNPADAGKWFTNSVELAPARPPLLFRNGVNLLAAGDRENAFRALRACWTLDAAHEVRICDLVPGGLTLADLIEHVVPSSKEAIEYVLSRYFPNDDESAERRLLLDRLKTTSPAP